MGLHRFIKKHFTYFDHYMQVPGLFDVLQRVFDLVYCLLQALDLIWFLHPELDAPSTWLASVITTSTLLACILKQSTWRILKESTWFAWILTPGYWLVIRSYTKSYLALTIAASTWLSLISQDVLANRKTFTHISTKPCYKTVCFITKMYYLHHNFPSSEI